MNIKKIIYLNLALLFGYFSSAIADDSQNIFLQLDGGYSFSNNLKGSYKNNIGNSPIIGIGAKYQLCPKMKLGTSLSYRPNYKYSYNHPIPDESPLKTSQKMNIASFMVNTSYDLINIADKFIPYIEVGAGVSRIGLSDYTMEGLYNQNGKAKSNFSYNAGVGAAFKVSEGVFVDLSYKYNNFGKIKQPSIANDIEKGKISSNDFIISLRFKL
jgi:opacity protein-like surface antigen